MLLRFYFVCLLSLRHGSPPPSHDYSLAGGPTAGGPCRHEREGVERASSPALLLCPLPGNKWEGGIGGEIKMGEFRKAKNKIDRVVVVV